VSEEIAKAFDADAKVDMAPLTRADFVHRCVHDEVLALLLKHRIR
jgi:hypothetical protein